MATEQHGIDVGTEDLPYRMACHWPLGAGREVEEALLARCHAGLVRQGVPGYTWADCLEDYRASIARCLFFLVVTWE